MVTVTACTPNGTHVPTWTQALHLAATYMAGVVVGEDGKGKCTLGRGSGGLPPQVIICMLLSNLSLFTFRLNAII